MVARYINRINNFARPHLYCSIGSGKLNPIIRAYSTAYFGAREVGRSAMFSPKKSYIEMEVGPRQ